VVDVTAQNDPAVLSADVRNPTETNTGRRPSSLWRAQFHRLGQRYSRKLFAVLAVLV